MGLWIRKSKALPLFVDYLFDEFLTTLDHRLIQLQIYNSVLKGSPVIDLHIKDKKCSYRKTCIEF